MVCYHVKLEQDIQLAMALIKFDFSRLSHSSTFGIERTKSQKRYTKPRQRSFNARTLGILILTFL